MKRWMWKFSKSRIVYLWLYVPKEIKDVDFSIGVEVSWYQVYLRLLIFGFGFTIWEHRLSLVDINRLRYCK